MEERGEAVPLAAAETYDAMIFVDRSTPTKPSAKPERRKR
jgi:hypothetical protein